MMGHSGQRSLDRLEGGSFTLRKSHLTRGAVASYTQMVSLNTDEVVSEQNGLSEEEGSGFGENWEMDGDGEGEGDEGQETRENGEAGVEDSQGFRRGVRGEMRKSCDECTNSKTKCIGGQPCSRCKKKGTPCHFSKRLRCGPKRRHQPKRPREPRLQFESDGVAKRTKPPFPFRVSHPDAGFHQRIQDSQPELPTSVELRSVPLVASSKAPAVSHPQMQSLHASSRNPLTIPGSDPRVRPSRPAMPSQLRSDGVPRTSTFAMRPSLKSVSAADTEGVSGDVGLLSLEGKPSVSPVSHNVDVTKASEGSDDAGPWAVSIHREPLNLEEQVYLTTYRKSVDAFIPVMDSNVLIKLLKKDSDCRGHWDSGSAVKETKKDGRNGARLVNMSNGCEEWTSWGGVEGQSQGGRGGGASLCEHEKDRGGGALTTVDVVEVQQAEIWAAIGVGALFEGAVDKAQEYMQRSRQNLHLWFDSGVSEVISVSLLHTVYWLHFLEAVKMKRWYGFAQQAARELITALPEHLRISLSFLSILVTMTITPEKANLLGLRDPTGWGVVQVHKKSLDPRLRVLATVSCVCQQMLRIAHPGPGNKVVDNPLQFQVLLQRLLEEEAVMSSQMETCHHAIAVVQGLIGYFYLRMDRPLEAISCAEKVCSAVLADCCILNLPLTFSLCDASRCLLEARVEQTNPSPIQKDLEVGVRSMLSGNRRERQAYAAASEARAGGSSSEAVGGWCAMDDIIFHAYQSARPAVIAALAEAKPAQTWPASTPLSGTGAVKNLSRAEVASLKWKPSDGGAVGKVEQRSVWRQMSVPILGTSTSSDDECNDNHPTSIQRAQTIGPTPSKPWSNDWAEDLNLNTPLVQSTSPTNIQRRGEPVSVRATKVTSPSSLEKQLRVGGGMHPPVNGVGDRASPVGMTMSPLAVRPPRRTSPQRLSTGSSVVDDDLLDTPPTPPHLAPQDAGVGDKVQVGGVRGDQRGEVRLRGHMSNITPGGVVEGEADGLPSSIPFMVGGPSFDPNRETNDLSEMIYHIPR